jgi:hypothetical protein
MCFLKHDPFPRDDFIKTKDWSPLLREKETGLGVGENKATMVINSF